MIKAVRLRNFQSHALTELKLDPGVNSIIGSSNNGKTAILRAVSWLKDNRPAGLEYVSHWNRDKKGYPVEATEATLQLEIAGNFFTVTRIRKKTDNVYEIWTEESEDAGAPDQTFEAVQTDVPEEVTKLLNFSDVNVQRQLDAPFLLSASAADVARFFNRIIRLDLIDRVLGSAETRRIRAGQKRKELEATTAEVEKELKSFDWIEGTERVLEKAENVQNRLSLRETKAAALRELLGDYEACRQQRSDPEIVCAIAAEKKVKDAECLNARLLLIKKKEMDLAALVEGRQILADRLREVCPAISAGELVNGYEAKRNVWSDKKRKEARLLQLLSERTGALADSLGVDTGRAEELLRTAQDFKGRVEEKRRNSARLAAMISDYRDADHSVVVEGDIIALAEAEMPDVCPTCGKPWHKKECE